MYFKSYDILDLSYIEYIVSIVFVLVFLFLLFCSIPGASTAESTMRSGNLQWNQYVFYMNSQGVVTHYSCEIHITFS
jgi:hypothetical protein